MVRVIDDAFELFSLIEPHVVAHTVEQFSIAEVTRLLGYKKVEGKRFLNNWSSVGGKNYVTPLLEDFFKRYGETNFEDHIKRWAEVKTRRPLVTLIKQKLKKNA